MAAPPLPDRSSQRSPVSRSLRHGLSSFMRKSPSLTDKKPSSSMPPPGIDHFSPRSSIASSSSSPSGYPSPDKLVFSRTPLPPMAGRPRSEFNPDASPNGKAPMLRSPRPSTTHAGRTLSVAQSMSNLTPRNVLIAGASGRKASLLINSLLSTPTHGSLKILSFSERGDVEAKRVYASLPQEHFFMADCIDIKLFRQALTGVDVLFYNPPAHHGDWVSMATAVMNVAKEMNVGHFVLYSILHPQITKLIHHNDRLKAEEHLIESGLNYTIIQPGVPMQNVDVRTIVSTSQYCLPYPHTTLQSFVDIHDVALVVRKIILNPEPHNRATYELVGQTCTHEEIASDIAMYANKDEGIECVRIERSQFVGKSGNEYETDVLERVLLYYERRGVTGNSNILRWLLGRAPTTFSIMLHRDYQVAEPQEFVAE